MELVFLFRTGKVGKYEIRSGVSSTFGHARSEASKRLNWFLTKDCTRFKTLFGLVLLCLFSTVARVVRTTATRYARHRLLGTLFVCASGPCVHVEGDVEKRTRWCFVCVGHHAHIGTQRSGSTHAQHIKTSVRLQAVGVAWFCQMFTNTQRKCFLFNLVFRKHV